MRRFRFGWLLFFPCAMAMAQNDGIDHRFGQGGVASLGDPQDAAANVLGVVACAVSNDRLRLVVQVDNGLGSVLVDAAGRHAGPMTRVVVPPGGLNHVGACGSDGRIVVAYQAPGAGSDWDVQVLRLRSDGSLDPGFGVGGLLRIDMDAHAGLPLLGPEVPVGINLESGGGVLLNLRLGVFESGTFNAGLVRLDAGGEVRFARHYSSLPGFITPYSAAASGVAADGALWMAGRATRLQQGLGTWFRARLDPLTGEASSAVAGNGPEHVDVFGGRMLADGATMVLAARSTVDGISSQPRLMVFREASITHVELPPPFDIAGSPAALHAGDSFGSAIPTAEGRILVLGTLVRSAAPGEEVATYLALVELGASAAADRVDTRYGINGRSQFAWRCSGGVPLRQGPRHATQWHGRALLTGWHTRGCGGNGVHALLARVQNAGDVHADGFE